MHFTIEGLHPYNGDFRFVEDAALTNQDFHTIKKISGLRAGELEEAMEAEDNDLLVAFAVIALEHAGLKVDVDVLWNAKPGQIKLVEDEEDAEQSPPVSAPPSTPDASESGAEKQPSFGAHLSNGSDPLAARRSPTGSQPSETPTPDPASDRQTSVA